MDVLMLGLGVAGFVVALLYARAAKKITSARDATKKTGQS